MDVGHWPVGSAMNLLIFSDTPSITATPPVLPAKSCVATNTRARSALAAVAMTYWPTSIDFTTCSTPGSPLSCTSSTSTRFCWPTKA